MTSADQQIVEALQVIPWIGKRGARQAQSVFLGEGEYNNVFHVSLHGRVFALRLPKPDRLKKSRNYFSEYSNLSWANLYGLGPAIRYFDYEKGILLMDYFPGQPLHDVNLTEGRLHLLGGLFSRLHQIPVCEYEYDVVGRKIDYLWSRFLKMPQTLRSKLIQVKSSVDEARQLLQSTAPDPCFCHNDLRGPNILVDGDEMLLIDWEYSGLGDPDVDVASFAHYMGLSDEQISTLSAGYGGNRSERLRIARIQVARPVITIYFSLRQAYLHERTDAPGTKERYMRRAEQRLADTHDYIQRSHYQASLQYLQAIQEIKA